MVMTTLDSEQNMPSICRTLIELFHKGIDSEVITLAGGDLPKETHQMQLSSRAAKSNHTILACLALLSLFLFISIYRTWKSCFRERK
jgi:hypothetical protein